MNYIIIAFSIIIVVILVFMHDLKYIEIRLLAEEYPNIIEIQNKYDECIKKKSGACDIIKNRLDMINSKKPSMLSSFFIWTTDGLTTIFNNLNPKNFGLLIILIIALKLYSNF